MKKIKDLSIVKKPDMKHTGAGHRKRLRNKFLKSGLDGFHDYEIVELLLTMTATKVRASMPKFIASIAAFLRYLAVSMSLHLALQVISIYKYRVHILNQQSKYRRSIV